MVQGHKEKAPNPHVHPQTGGILRANSVESDMKYVETLLGIIAVLLLLISVKVDDIAKRLKERFPTQKEVESQIDP